MMMPIQHYLSPLSTMLAVMAATIEATKIDGEIWPDDALYCVSMRQRTWPTYKGDYHANFFQNREQLDAFLADQNAWAKLEDNYLDYTVYEWDFGPKVIAVN